MKILHFFSSYFAISYYAIPLSNYYLKYTLYLEGEISMLKQNLPWLDSFASTLTQFSNIYSFIIFTGCY